TCATAGSCRSSCAGSLAASRGRPDAAVESRWRALCEAGIAVTSELSLDALLEKITQTAADLTGAKYAALGVIDRSRTHLERFLTVGLPEGLHDKIGDLPHGRGILGAIIRDATT